MTALLSHRRAVLLAVCMLMTLALPAFAAPTYTVGGYVQGRYTDLLGTPPDGVKPDGTFDIKRAYVYVDAAVDERVGAFVLAGGYPTFRLEHAYVKYTIKPYQARLGLAPIPFGYESPVSASRLITLDRSQVITNIFVRNAGRDVYSMDRGVFLSYQPGKGAFAQAALVNGNHVESSSDPDNKKAVSARGGLYIPGGEVALSYYDGDRPCGAGGALTHLHLVGFDIETALGPVTLISELVTGKDAGAEKDGGYVTLAYREAGTAWQPYVRADYFDPNTDTQNNIFRRGTVGVNYFTSPTSKLTLEYQTIDDEANAKWDGFLGTQFQVVF